MGMKINAHLPIPADLKAEYPLSSQILKLKEKRDREIREIFEGKSDKFLVIVGPCSADNEDSVCEYVSKLATINEKVSDRLMIIPRIYTHIRNLHCPPSMVLQLQETCLISLQKSL